MRCNHCGKEWDDGSAVCPACGALAGKGEAGAVKEGAAQEQKEPSGAGEEASEDMAVAGDKKVSLEKGPAEAGEGPAPSGEGAAPTGEGAPAAHEGPVEAGEGPAPSGEGAAPAGEGAPVAHEGPGGDVKPEAGGIGEALSAVEKEAPVKPKPIGKAVAALAVAAVLICVGIFAFLKMTEKDPKEVVIQAFENVYVDSQVKPMEELFGFSEFRKNAATTNRETSIQLMMESCSDSDADAWAGTGARIEAKQDRDKEKGSGNLGILFNHMDLVNLNLYYGDKTVMAAVPELSSRVFTLDVSEGLAERLQRSEVLGPMLEESGMDVPGLVEFLSEYVDWVEEQTQNAADPNTMEGIYGLWNRYKKGCQAQEDLKAALTVEKAGKADFQIDGKTVPCRGYQVHVGKDSMISFLRTSSDFFLKDEDLRQYFLESLEMSVRMAQLSGGVMEGDLLGGLSVEEQLQKEYDEVEEYVSDTIGQLDRMLNDMDMMVYVDKKGRLAAVEGEMVLNSPYEGVDSSYQAVFQANLRGGSYLTQNAWAKVELSDESDGRAVSLEMDKTGNYDGKKLEGNLLLDIRMVDEGPIAVELDGSYDSDGGDFAMAASFSREGSGSVNITMDGIVSELEKGSAIHMDMDEVKLVMDSDFMGGSDFELALSGEYDLRPLSGDITEPEGTLLDIVAATEEEWEAVSMEMYFSLIGLVSRLQSVLY